MKLSRSQSIAHDIVSSYIDNEALQAGERLPSIRELQQLYDASSTVILHALNILETQGIVEKNHGRGCYVKDRSLAQTVRTPNMLGLVIDTRGYEVMMHTQYGAQTAASEAGYQLMVGDSELRYEREREEVHKMVAAGCQAVLVFPTPRSNLELASDYLNSELRDFPIVLIDRALPEHKRTQVIFDNFQAGEDMTKLLIGLGHRRIGSMMLGTPEGDYIHRCCRDRYAGYRHALASAGITLQPADQWLIDPRYTTGTTDDYRGHLLRWREQPDRPTAIIGLDDYHAILTIHAAQELGIDVPDELYVTGADNLNVARHFKPAFPTTAQDFRRAGEMAVRLALEEIQGKRDDRVVYMMPVPIERRRTTGMRHPDSASIQPDRPCASSTESEAVRRVGVDHREVIG